MNVIGTFLFILIGLIQFFAIISGLESWLGFHWIIAGPIAFIIAYIPLIGSIVGMVGAVDVWHWSWWQAALLFFGGVGISILFGGASFIFEYFNGRKNRNA